MTLGSTMFKLFVLTMIVMTLCTSDVDAWRRRRRRRRSWIRIRLRKVWTAVKPIAKKVAIHYVKTWLGLSQCLPISIVPRSDWRAGSPSGTQQASTNIGKIYIYDAGDKTCTDQASCETRLRNLQEADRSDGFNDIQSNFLLGQDGQIYEGRGWDWAGEYPRDANDVLSIGVAFMGDFSVNAPNNGSQDALHNFLDCSTHLTNPVLVVDTGTPIYDVVKTWGTVQG